jgi:phage shock protein PspC (stress-responsive transcriptional regulator)
MKKLYRDNPSVSAGVCGGLGSYFGIDDSIIRILFVVLIFTPFPIILTYLLMWIIIPKSHE